MSSVIVNAATQVNPFTGNASNDNPVLLSGNKTLTALDDNCVYSCANALTVIVPAGLSPRPQVVFIPPPTGNLTISTSGGALINGTTSSITRTRALNPVGVAIMSYAEADAYGVSGS